MPRWVINASAGGFWVLLGLIGLGTWKLRRAWADVDIVIEDLRQEALDSRDADDVWDPANWTWIVDVEETGEYLPMYVPDDIADQALQVLDDETQEEHDAIKQQGWRWLLTPMQLRHAMHIAQQEESIEVALFTFMANANAPADD